MLTSRLSPVALLAALLVTVTVSGVGCRSRCSSDADCVKNCPCTETSEDPSETRNAGQDCAVVLRCENTLCEGEEGLLCGMPGDTFCSTYAGNGLCGTKKCSADKECRKTCECAATITVGEQQQQCCFRLRRTGTCLEEFKACDSDYARPCEEVCREQNLGQVTQCSDVCTNLDTQAGDENFCSNTTCPSTGLLPAAPGQ
ncbi:MAG: hypothetical protein AB2A00_37830 [Myxococcota bacterium]